MNRSDCFRNILIIKPGAIGDLLQLTPVIRALKARYPDARISLLVGSTATARLFQFNKHVHETLVFERKGLHRSFRSLLELRRLLGRRQFDLVINFQRSNLKIWFLASAAFPCRVLIYHKAPNVHVVENYLAAVAPLGIDPSGRELELKPGEDSLAFAERIISPLDQGGRMLIALNPGASHPVNRWSVELFAVLADKLARELGARVMILGGREDVRLAEEIAARTESTPILMAGRADLLELGALLQRCALLVSGDTGPLHLATAVGTKVVALFGAADPYRTGPVGRGHRIIQAESVACVPCRSRVCRNAHYLECMEKISVDKVFQAIVEMVGMTGPLS